MADLTATPWTWRVWTAFESSPGVTPSPAPDTRQHALALAKSCRGPTGKLDVAEFEYWLDLVADYSHAWGAA